MGTKRTISREFAFASLTIFAILCFTGCVTVKSPPDSLAPAFKGIADIQVSPADVPRFGKFEIAAFISTAYSNPFDPREITLDAEFVSPSGEKRVCPGFLYAFARTEGAPDEWRIRFSPDEEGTWTWILKANTPGGSVESKRRSMNCTASPQAGPIRICMENPVYFEHADGSFYYPIGHNMAWNNLAEYQQQFALIKASGENWSRVWVAPWNCEIEWSSRGNLAYKGLGNYNLDNAAKLDGIVEAAEKTGVYLQLVLHEHCRMSARTNPEWQNNPYNKALGGPCESPQDFLTDAKARQLTKNRLRYIVARWGYSAHVMAWELFNEADLVDDFRFATDTAWHKEMAEYLNSIDPHRHLVTTSYASSPNANVFKLPTIDFTQSHVYLQDIPGYFAQIYAPFRQFQKPHFIGEFGRGTADGIDAQDKEGRVIHSGIWSQFMLPEAGNAMSWWWYDLIHPNNLYRHFAALSSFAEGLDRRTASWELQTGRLGNDRVMALASRDQILFWMYDPQILPWTDGPIPTPAEFQADLTITNTSEGLWSVEQWDTYKGVMVSSNPFVADNDVLIIPIRFTAPDAAFKLCRTDSAVAEKRIPQLLLEPWETAAVVRTIMEIPRAPTTFENGRTVADGNSFTFSVSHDSNNLLVTVRVTDNQLMRRNSGGNLWKDDCVELWIDSRNDASFFNNMPNNPGCFQFVIAPSLKEPGKTDTITYRNPDWNDKGFPSLETTSQITTNGYIIEAKIPLAALRGDAPVADPSRIGFNVSTCDSDESNGTTTWKHLLWQGTEEWDARQWGIGILM